MGLDDQSADGGFQLDDRRRISRLAAFDPDEDLILFHGVALLGFQADDAAGDAAAEDGVALGDFRDAAESEDGFLEVGFLGLDGFDAEVFHAGFIEDDGVRVVGGMELGTADEGEREWIDEVS